MNTITGKYSSPTKNIEYAFTLGMKVPEVKVFSSFDEAVQFAEGEERVWVYRGEGILMEQLEGPRFSYEARWDGEKWAIGNMAVEDRHLLSGGQGPVCKTNCITVFEHSVERSKMGKYIRNVSPEVEVVRLNCVLNSGKAYYEQIEFGICEPRDVLIDMLSTESGIGRGFACALMVYTYPYSPEESYFLYDKGESIKSAWNTLYMQTAGLDQKGYCFRIDGDAQPRRTFHELKRTRFL